VLALAPREARPGHSTNELQVKDLIARPNARARVLVLELERQFDLCRVEAY
jgi:hypothetical protein